MSGPPAPASSLATLSQEEWDGLQERTAIRRNAPRGSTHKAEYPLIGVALERRAAWLVVPVGPLWLVGFLHVTERRYGTLRISHYLRSAVEPK